MRKARILFGIVCLLILVAPGYGQSWDTLATVKVPFEFQAGNTVLPAGAYEVQFNFSTHMLRLFDREQSVGAVSMFHNIYLVPGELVKSSTLLFSFDGQRHVLHQVKVSGQNQFYDLIHGADVVELAATPST